MAAATFPRMKQGDTVKVGDKLAIVVKAGLGRIDYSVFLYFQDGTTKIFTEIPFWQRQGSIRKMSHKKENKVWAEEYCRTHLVPEL